MPILVSFLFLVKTMSEVTHLRQIPSPSMQSFDDYRTNHGGFKSNLHSLPAPLEATLKVLSLNRSFTRSVKKQAISKFLCSVLLPVIQSSAAV